MATSAPADVTPAAAAPDLCWRCDYDLRGIGDDQPCPECGLLAERSRRPSEHLTDARPGWLLWLSAGVWLILLAHVLAPVWLYFLEDVSDLAREWAWGSRWRMGRRTAWDGWLVHLPLAGFDLPALLLLAGVVLLTRPEPGGLAAAQRVARHRARLMRVAAAVPLAAAALAHWGAGRTWAGLEPGEWHKVLVAGLLTLGCIPLPALTFYHLRHLARRVLSPSLAEHCAIVGWGASLTLAGIPLLFALMTVGQSYWGGSWSTRSDASLWIVLLMCLAPIFFLLWSALTLVRFAIAFARAHRGARRKWAAADRASGTVPVAA